MIAAIDVPLSQIGLLKNVRDVDEKTLGELVESIRVHGIVEPLIVRRNGKAYELVCGYRRLAAAKKLKLATVPVVVRDLKDEQIVEVQLTENLQREGLNAIDEALALQRYRTLTKCSEATAAKVIGKSQPYVANRLRLLHLPELAKDSIRRGILSARHGEALLKMPRDMPTEDVKRTVEFAVKGNWSARLLEENVKNSAQQWEWRKEEAKRQEAEKKRQAAALAKLKHKKCPECGKPAVRVYYTEAECGNWHSWNKNTGKPTAEPELDTHGHTVTQQAPTESKVVRSFHDALAIARKVMEGLTPDQVRSVFLEPGRFDITLKGSHQGGWSAYLKPHVYKDGEKTAVEVRAWDPKQIKAAKEAFRKWEKEQLPKAGKR